MSNPSKDAYDLAVMILGVVLALVFVVGVVMMTIGMRSLAWWETLLIAAGFALCVVSSEMLKAPLPHRKKCDESQE